MDLRTKKRDSDMKEAVAALKKLSLGQLSYELFVEMARLVVMPTIEFIPLRMHEGRVQVLLLERDAEDVWSGMLHVPGSVVRATDGKGSFKDALDRIKINELGNPSLNGELKFMKFIFLQNKRGSEIAFIHWIEIKEQGKNGQFYDVENLPKNIVEHQIVYIKEAAEQFKQSKRASLA